MEKLVCLIVARNLGDAVIQSAFLRKLVASGYSERYIAWVRPQIAFLFRDIPNCEIATSQFPVGTAKNFGLKNAWLFLKESLRIRRLRPSVTLDLVGDFRERAFARLTGAPKRLQIGWANGHPHRVIIRNPFGDGNPVFVVPKTCPNVYLSYGMFLSYLTGGKETSILSTVRNSGAGQLKIGLHPFASQECKLWPAENWLALAQQLLTDGHELTMFGAGGEKAMLEQMFAPLLSRVTIFTRSLADFTSAVANLDLFIGLDSFGVHMSQRQGVQGIMINAGNDPTVWTPPGARVLAHSGGCQYYPCSNVPKCQGSSTEYVCVRSIKTEEVLAAIGPADLAVVNTVTAGL